MALQERFFVVINIGPFRAIEKTTTDINNKINNTNIIPEVNYN